jgi:hypothetical protein
MRNLVVFQKYINEIQENLSKKSLAFQLFYSCMPVLEKKFLIKSEDNYCFSLLRLFVFAVFKKSNFSIDWHFKNKTGSICIFPAQLNHLDCTIPLYKILVKQGINVQYFIQSEEISNNLKRERIPYNKINIKIQNGVNINSLIILFQLIKLLCLCLYFSLKFKMITLFFLTIQALNELTTILAFREAAKFIVLNQHPKYILLGYDNSLICRPVNLVSSYYKIPTGCIQHGTLNYILASFSITEDYFVWDISDKECLDINNKNVNTYVTGPINHDSKVNYYNNPNYIKIFKKINKIRKKHFKVGLVAFSGPGHNVSLMGHQKNIKILHEFAKNVENIFFIIKLHPKDQKDYYKNIENLQNVIVTKEHKMHVNDIEPFLLCSDFAITGASTVTFEAWRKNIPVIFMDTEKELDHILFINNNSGYKVSNLNDLTISVKSIIEQDQKFITKYHYISAYAERYKSLSALIPETIVESIILKRISYEKSL